ncbi:MAG: hypothetical protein OEX19_07655, partial [Gammaproteobacteria bacterium]|nr:hypothetical protein [Gammaproteobacteria bacterium]
SVNLTWAAATGASSYNIYRSETSASYGAALTTGVTTTGYDDSTAVNGTTYYYTVTAVNAVWESSMSGEVSALPLPPLPATPTGFSATTGDQELSLSWSSATDADSWNIYKYDTSTWTYSLLISGVTGTSYVDTGLTNGTYYNYKLNAVNLAGESTGAVYASGLPLPPPPTNPANLIGTPGFGSVSLTWNANPVSEAVTSYTVYRSTTSGVYGVAYATGLTSPAFTDFKATYGATYYYQVTATNMGGEGTPSTETGILPLLPAPHLSAESGDAQTVLSWNALSGVSQYDVYRSETRGTYGAVLATITAGTTYTDTTVINGTTYYYIVTATDITGTSPNSNEVRANPQFYSAMWNEYLRTADMVTPCDGNEAGDYSACTHIGEQPQVELQTVASCTGITAVDQLGLFSWTCDDTTYAPRVAMIGSPNAGLKLSDLIDWASPVVDWLPNALEVSDTGTLVETTPNIVWWNNPVEDATDKLMTAGDALAGTIYTITGPSTRSYTIDADRVSFLVKPGVSYSGDPAVAEQNLITLTNAKFLWFEGDFVLTGDKKIISGSNVRQSVFSNINMTGDGDTWDLAIDITSGFRNRFENSTYSTIATGIQINGAYGNLFSDLNFNENGYSGMRLLTGNSNTSRNLLYENGGSPLTYHKQTSGLIENVTVHNSGQLSVSWSSNLEIRNIELDRGSFNINRLANSLIENVRAINVHSGTAFAATGLKNSYVNNMLLAGAGTSSTAKMFYLTSYPPGPGITGAYTEDSVFANITISNSDYYGTDFNDINNNVFINLLVANSNSVGARYSGNDQATFMNLAALDNPYSILSYYSYNTKYAGNLLLDNCAYRTDSVTPDSNGFEDYTCIPLGPEAGTLISGQTTATSFVGKVTTDDSVNISDNNDIDLLGPGLALFDNITDWLNFEVPNRGWGKDGGVYPDLGNRGACTTGVNCRIWDWNLLGTDTVARNINTLHLMGNVADTVSHTLLSGATVAFLRNAVEIAGDGFGDDDGLCESSETCLYTPNIGVYQGHGAWISAGTFVDGDTLTGITLLMHESNGY